MAKGKRKMGPMAREVKGVMVRGDVRVMAWVADAAARCGMSRSEFFERWAKAMMDAESQVAEWVAEARKARPGAGQAEDAFAAFGRLLARSGLGLGALDGVIHRGELAWVEELRRERAESFIASVERSQRDGDK